jgi:hypothetical protein
LVLAVVRGARVRAQSWGPILPCLQTADLDPKYSAAEKAVPCDTEEVNKKSIVWLVIALCVLGVLVFAVLCWLAKLQQKNTEMYSKYKTLQSSVKTHEEGDGSTMFEFDLDDGDVHNADDDEYGEGGEGGVLEDLPLPA